MRRREQILMTAEEVFGNPEVAEVWVTKEAIGLSRPPPCMLLETDQGTWRLRLSWCGSITGSIDRHVYSR